MPASREPGCPLRIVCNCGVAGDGRMADLARITTAINWLRACGSSLLKGNIQMKKLAFAAAAISACSPSGLRCRSGCASLYQGAPDGCRRVRLDRLLHRRQRRLGYEPQLLDQHCRWRRSVPSGDRRLPRRRRRHGRWSGRLSLAGWQLGVRPRSARQLGRLPGFEREPAWGASRQPLQDRRVRPVHRPDRLCRQQRPVLRQGRCGGDRQPL